MICKEIWEFIFFYTFHRHTGSPRFRITIIIQKCEVKPNIAPIEGAFLIGVEGALAKIHLNELSQERRKYILERFFSRWNEKDDSETEIKKGHIRTVKTLNITGTDDPVYTVEFIDDWNVNLGLTI